MFRLVMKSSVKTSSSYGPVWVVVLWQVGGWVGGWGLARGAIVLLFVNYQGAKKVGGLYQHHANRNVFLIHMN